MERNLLLAIAFLMGFVFTICPIPVALNAFDVLGTFFKNILSLLGFILMIYSSIEIVIRLIKSHH